MKKSLIAFLVILGLAFVALAVYYWATPAGSLASWAPGHEAGSNHHHLKHGLAALILGLGCWLWAWFGSAPQKAKATSAENNRLE